MLSAMHEFTGCINLRHLSSFPIQLFYNQAIIVPYSGYKGKVRGLVGAG